MKITENHFYGKIAIDMDVPDEKAKKILSEFPSPFSGVEKNKNPFAIENKEHGEYVGNIVAIVVGYSVEPTANGKRYLKARFQTNGGTFNAKAWDNGFLDKYLEMLEEHTVFELSGRVEQYPRDTGPKSLVIDGMVPYRGKVNPFELMPMSISEENFEKMIVELVVYLEMLDEPFRSVALTGLKKIWNEFATKAAARSHHHAYLGGLLKHTLGLLRISRFIRNASDPIAALNTLIDTAFEQTKKEGFLLKDAPNLKLAWKEKIDHIMNCFNALLQKSEEEINFDVVDLAILLHDTGKIYEYGNAGEDTIAKWSLFYPNANFGNYKVKQTGITTDPTSAGIHHIIFSIMFLKEILNEIRLNIEDIIKLNNCIAAHHGKREWGSVASMEFPESIIVHLCDLFDATWETSVNNNLVPGKQAV